MCTAFDHSERGTFFLFNDRGSVLALYGVCVPPFNELIKASTQNIGNPGENVVLTWPHCPLCWPPLWSSLFPLRDRSCFPICRIWAGVEMCVGQWRRCGCAGSKPRTREGLPCLYSLSEPSGLLGKEPELARWGMRGRSVARPPVGGEMPRWPIGALHRRERPSETRELPSWPVD